MESQVHNSTYRITKDLRLIPNDSSASPLGPGEIFRVEIVTLGITIREGWIIRHPTLYLVIDEWSEYIAGFHASLSSTASVGVAIALLSSLEDKVEYCQRLGIQISPTDWPTLPLPRIICSDRAEIFSRNISNCLVAFGVAHKVKPPDQPDWKALSEGVAGSIGRAVEANFSRGFGVQPSRILTRLTLDEFTSVVVFEVIKHNHAHRHGVAVHSQAKRQSVPNTPVALVAWGLRTLIGSRPGINLDAVRKALLPFAKRVWLTKLGIRLLKKGLTYRPSDDKLLHTLSSRGEMPVEIQYDPRSCDVVWLTHSVTNELIPCFAVKPKPLK